MRIANERLGDGDALVRWQVVPAGGDGHRGLRRTGRLTPYLAEIIVADALRAGRGGRLDVVVPPRTSEVGMVWVRDRLARVSARGVCVTVRRNGGDGGRAQPDAA